MIGLERKERRPRFVPDYIAKSLSDVDFELLKNRGIKYVAFDADSTLVHFRGTVLSEETEQLLKSKRRLFEAWCIASNRPTNDLQELGRTIDAPVIRASLLTRKPRRKYFEKVIQHFNATPEQIAMVGDKLIADMWGAKRSGLVTVWVAKIGPDSPWDWLLRTRWFEKFLMRSYVPK